jgi:YVTN family beta-propeller protein
VNQAIARPGKRIIRHTRSAVIAAALAFLIFALLSGFGATLAAGPAGYTWVGQNPLGTGAQLYATSAASATAAWSVGEYGTILYWNGTTLIKQVSNTTNNLYGVFARSTTRVWAVGEKGTILYTSNGGTTWTKQGVGVTPYDLTSVSACSNTTVWAVGGYDGFHNAVILRTTNTGGTWTVHLSQATGGFTSVYALSATRAWAVNVWTWYWNGTRWAKVNDGDSGTGIDPYRISGSAANNLWAVGWSGKVLRSVNSGTTWTEVTAPPGGTSWPVGISALSTTSIYVAGWGGEIAMYDGTTWASLDSGTTNDLYDIDIFSAGNVFSAGDHAFIRYGTPTWLGMSGGTGSQLNAVHARDVSNVRVAGTNVATYGNIQTTANGGATWGNLASGTTETINGVDTFDATHTWTAGQAHIRFYSGAAWTTQVDGTDTVGSTITIGTGSSPRSCAANPVTNKIYVANAGTNNVSVINSSTDTVITTISGVGASPRGLCVNPVTNKVYVTSNTDNTICVIDGSTDTISKAPFTYGSTTTPYRCCVNTVTNKVYVANFGSQNISVIDGTTDTFLTNIALGAGTGPISCGINMVTNKIYTANHTAGTCSVIDGATDALITSIPVNTNPYDIGVNASTNKVYVPNAGSGNVSVIDGATDTLKTTVVVGTNDRGVGVNPNTNKIYVENSDTNNVSVIDGTSDTVLTTISIGAGTGPFGACANTYNNKVYVTNWTNGTVSVLRSASFMCISAAATNRVWAGASDGSIRYYNGTTWATQTPDAAFFLAYNGIATPDSSHVWAVRDLGEIVYWNGTTWTKQTSNTTNTLRAVTALNSSTAWAVGDGGVIRYTNNAGATWQTQTSGTTENLLGVSAADATHVWAVGTNGTILFFNGTSWSAQESNTTNTLRAVSAYDANDAWAVGDNGTIIFADPPYLKGCAPGWGRPGDTVDIEVIDAYTHFSAGTPTVSFGTGVNVVPGSVNVWDNTHIYAQVQVDPGATLGPRDVSVTTLDETAVLPGGFVVGDGPEVTVVTPHAALRGQTLCVEISGIYTNFVTGDSIATFSGPGIKVNSTTVLDPTHVRASITVAPDAQLGAGDVNVVTGNESPAPLGGGLIVGAVPPAITSISPTAGPRGTVVTINGSDFGASRAGSGGAVSFNGKTATQYPEWSDTRIQAVVPQGATPGPVTVFTASGGTSNGRAFAVPASAFYFSEGCTGANFAEYLCLGNPDGKAAKASVTYFFSDGTSRNASYDIPATGRTTVNVNSEVGPGKEVSMQVFSDTAGLVAERPMYFNYNGVWTGGSDTVGATAPGSNWYFAEGNTLPDFDEYVSVLNTTDATANLTFHYMVEGTGERDVQGSVGAHSRATFRTRDQIGSNLNASLHLSSDQAVVAERPMYFNYRGLAANGWTGGHDVVGANSPQKQWYLAEGTTRAGFEEWLCLQNPGGSDITVNAIYQLAPGQGLPRVKSYTVPAGQRVTVSVNREIGPDKDDSIQLISDSSFIAERAMYFNYEGAWTGGHDVLGANNSAKTWYFAEGTTRDGFDEWLCLQNPGNVDAHVTVTCDNASGRGSSKTVTVSANSRLTVDVNQLAGPNQDISAKVSSDSPIIAERSMYFDYYGWTGGHAVVGFTGQQ